MSKKLWLQEEGGRSLAGILGAYGCATNNLETVEDLVAEACMVFDLKDVGSIDAALRAIKTIPRHVRRKRAERNLGLESRAPIASDREDTSAPEGKLLNDLAVAVINAGRADIIHDLPDVMAYFGARLPTVEEVAETAFKVVSGDLQAGDRVISIRAVRAS